MAAKKGGLLGAALGIVMLGVTIYVVAYSWKKGTERA